MLLVIAFYGALATAAIWATWHEKHLRTLGAVLVIDWAISNLTFGSDTQTRAGVYTMLEIMVLATAYVVSVFSRDRTTRWLMAVIGIVAVLSIGCNIVLAYIGQPTRPQQYVHDAATNLCFAIECVMAFSAGIHDGVGIGRFNNWLRGGRSAASVDALEAEGPER